jgi:glycosyltransferase involved in cell wall biosynthesis
MPLVSVIIPTYNRAHTIERALQSIAAQTLQDFEIIVVDDASTDNTAAVVEQFNDPRVLYLRHEDNRHAGAARNTGMAAATGQYIAFLDSDDAWLPEKLERQVGLLENEDKDCGCSYTGAIINFAGGLRKRSIDQPSYRGNVVAPYLLGKFTIWTPTFMFRTELLEQVAPFDADLIRSEDVDFYLRLLQHSRLSCVSEPMVELYLDMDKEIAEICESCDRIFLEKHAELIVQQGFLRSRYIYAMYEFRIGDRYLNEGRIGKGLKNIGRAMLTNPFLKPKAYAAMLLRLGRAVRKKIS